MASQGEQNGDFSFDIAPSNGESELVSEFDQNACSARNFESLFRQNKISTERASKEEQNDTNFSSIAPPSEELWVPKKF